MQIMTNQRRTNLNQRSKLYQEWLFSRISFSGRIPITAGRMANTHKRIALINKSCCSAFNKSVDQSKTVAAIPKLRNIKSCALLLFSSSIRLRSSFNRGSCEDSTIKPPGGKSGLLVGLLLPSGGFYHQSSISQGRLARPHVSLVQNRNYTAPEVC